MKKSKIITFNRKKYNLIFTFFFLFTVSNLFSYDQSAIDDLNAGVTDLTFRDFSDADLSGRNISGKNFTGSVFTGTNLSASTLNNCNFTSVDATNSNLTGASVDNCVLKDMDLTEANLSNITIENSNLNGTICTETDMRNSSFANCTNKNMVLLKSLIESTTKQTFLQTKAISETCSFLVNSDTHVRNFTTRNPSKTRDINDKNKELEKFFSVTIEKNVEGKLKNNITKIIHSGDLVDNGNYTSSWGNFKSNYLDVFQNGPFSKENKIPALILMGNHDRYTLLFSDKSYTTSQIDRWNATYIQTTGEEGEDYYKVSDEQSNLDIYMLSECSTRNNYKPINWFINKFNPNKNCILASHYTPRESLNWWTDGDEPRYYQNHGGTYQQDVDAGTLVMEELESKLNPYKNNIKLYIGGHLHKTQLKRWTVGNSWIWVLNTAGRNRFGMVHFDKNGNIICVEFYHPGAWEKTLRFFPQLEDLTDCNDHKTRLIVKYYRKFYYRFPTISEINAYLNSSNTLWETYVEIKTSARL